MGNVADPVHFERIVPLFRVRCKTRIPPRLARLEKSFTGKPTAFILVEKILPGCPASNWHPGGEQAKD